MDAGVDGLDVFERLNQGGALGPVYRLRIDWENYTKKEIVERFEAWARANGPKTKRTGGRAHVPIDLLKCLAAYRIRQAGVTAERAAQALDQKFPDGRKRPVIPHFKHPSNWSEAVGRAKKELSRLESFLIS